MRPKPHCGILVVSIDVDEQSLGRMTGERILAAADALATYEAAKWMLNVLGEFGLPATWFVTHTDRNILRAIAGSGHEIGSLITTGVDARLSRQTLHAQLEQQSQAAGMLGVRITSMAIDTVQPIDHLDWLAKRGIRALRLASFRHPRQSQEQNSWRKVTDLRFGICNLPATSNVERAPWWKQWISVRRISQHIAVAGDKRQYCHLTFKLRSLSDSAAKWQARCILSSAAKHFHNAQNRPLTMSAAALSVMSQPHARRAHSILRAA